MQQPVRPGGGRYGIWGVAPHGEPVIKKSIFDTALDTADRIGSWNKNRYETMLKQGQSDELGLKNQETRATMQPRINAANVKSNTDKTMYPKLQAMELATKGATIKKIMAETGLNQAESVKAYAGAGHLRAMSGLVGQQSGWLADMRTGPSRGGGGKTYYDPKTGKLVSTDTTANTTQDQSTVAAAERADPLIEDIIAKQTPFMTIGGRLSLTGEGIGNLFGADNKGPSDFYQSEADKKLAAESLIKAYGLRVTDQATTMMVDAIAPHLGESPSGMRERLENTRKTIATNQMEAGNRLGQGNDITQYNPGYVPAMAQQGMQQGMQQPNQQASAMDYNQLAQEFNMSPQEVQSYLAEQGLDENGEPLN